MSNWHNKIDVTYSVSTYFFLSYFYTTTVTDNSFVTYSFIFTTSTFKIFYWSENTFAEKTITLRFVRSVVDSFRLEVHRVTKDGRFFVLNTSPLDSFKIDSGEASPIEILLNLFTGFLSLLLLFLLFIIVFTIDLCAIKKLIFLSVVGCKL